jgi:hypothetical protein
MAGTLARLGAVADGWRADRATGSAALPARPQQHGHRSPVNPLAVNLRARESRAAW